MKTVAKMALFVTGIIMIIGAISGIVLISVSRPDWMNAAVILALIGLAVEFTAGVYGVFRNHHAVVCLILGLISMALGAWFVYRTGFNWQAFIYSSMVTFIYTAAALLTILMGEQRIVSKTTRA